MRKVIFLDIDGVLNTALFHNKEEREGYRDKYGYMFDPNAVSNLKMIIDETGADIVISSSWKYMGVEKLREMWKERGLPGKIIDITPDSVSEEFLINADLDDMSYGLFRSLEIKEWMMNNGKDVSHYAIIDDMYDMLPEQQPHFILSDPNVGITEWDAMKAIAILNAEPGKGFANIIRELKEKKSLNDRLHYLEDLVSSIKESIEKGSMDKTAIISYMRHFPKRGVEEGWPEEVYAISDECVKLLLDYSKQYSFFAKDVSYGMFIKEYRALLAD